MSAEIEKDEVLSRDNFVVVARAYEKAAKQLPALASEIGELSKKKPDGPINKFKLGFINKLLQDLNLMLGTMRPFADFRVFDADGMPTNSDVKMILSLYLTACRAKKSLDGRQDRLSGRTFWYLEDEPLIEVESNDDRFYEERFSSLDEEDDDADEEDDDADEEDDDVDEEDE